MRIFAKQETIFIDFKSKEALEKWYREQVGKPNKKGAFYKHIQPIYWADNHHDKKEGCSIAYPSYDLERYPKGYTLQLVINYER